MGKRMETDQFVELVAAVVRSLPRDLDSAVAQGVDQRPERSRCGVERHPVVDGEDVEPTIGLDLAKFTFVSVLPDGKDLINGDEMRGRAGVF